MKIFRTGAYESFYDMPIQVDWSITKRCNYRCSYCFHYGYGRQAPPQLPFSTLEQLKNAVDNIASLNRPWYNVTFGGGEPTIHPHIFELMEMLHETLAERLNQLSIVSNGSRNEPLYKKIAEIAKSVHVELYISIHTDHVDMPHILELIENLSRDVNMTFNLMFNPAKREEVHLIYDILYEYRKRFPFHADVKPLFYDHVLDSRYTPEDLAWQKGTIEQIAALEQVVESRFPPRKEPKHSWKIFHDIEQDGERKIIETTTRNLNFTNGLLEFKGMYCVGNSAVLRIEEDGRCRGMVCGVAPYICNIFEKDALRSVRSKLVHAIQCPVKVCNCDANDLIPKFSSRVETMRFIEVASAKQEALFEQGIK